MADSIGLYTSDGLPAGALDQLLTNGPEAFDKAIADSQAQTQALMNQPKPPAPQSPEELNEMRDGHILRALRENPGRTRAEVERAYDNEVRLAKNSYNEKIAAKAAAERAAAPKPQLYDTTEMSSEDIIKLGSLDATAAAQYRKACKIAAHWIRNFTAFDFRSLGSYTRADLDRIASGPEAF